MSHENFRVAQASAETLDLAVGLGLMMVIVIASLVLYLIWRDKRAGVGKPDPRAVSRARKPQRRR